MEVTIGLAFIAGIVSFISPCVLPLVPAYIGYMGGRMTQNVAARAGAGGMVVSSVPTIADRFSTLTHGLAFVLGFTFVFVAIGLLSTAFIRYVGGENISTVTGLIGRVGGVMIIFFGLHFMGVMSDLFDRLLAKPSLLSKPLFSLAIAVIGSVLILWAFTGSLLHTDISGTTMLFGVFATSWTGAEPFPFGEPPLWPAMLAFLILTIFLLWLTLGGAFTRPKRFWTNTITSLQYAFYADTRRDMDVSGNHGLSGSALMGVVFSAGWTPCIGPVYGTVLTLAANGGDVGQAGGLLAAYSLGLGIPFLLTALLLDSAQGALRSLSRHMRAIKLVSGAFLVIIGVAVASGQLAALTQGLATGALADTSVRLEECTLRVANGEFGVDQIDDCMNGTLETTTPESGADTTETTADSAVDLIVGPESNDTETGTTTVETGRLAPGLITDLAEAIPDAGAAPADEGADTVGVDIGNVAPDFETVTDTGVPIMLSDLRGKVVLLNFWATWCGPCRIEMPEFEAAYNEHGDNQLAIVAVNNRETAADVVGFRDEYGLTFPMVMDERGTIQDRYGVFSYPSTYLIDENGVIVARHFGPLTAAQIQQLVDEALA